MKSVFKELHACIVYFTDAKSIWLDLEERFETPMSNKFLMGLNDSYVVRRSEILQSIPTLFQVYSLINYFPNMYLD